MKKCEKLKKKTNKDRNQIWTCSLGSGWARHGQARLKFKTRDLGGCAHCLVWFLNPVFQSQMVLICGRQLFQGFPIPTVQASAVPSFSSARSQTLKVIINKELARLSLSPNKGCNQMNVERGNSAVVSSCNKWVVQVLIGVFEAIVTSGKCPRHPGSAKSWNWSLAKNYINNINKSKPMC